MSADSVYAVWEHLLALSKIQLIIIGLSLALIVAVSKISRFLFLLGFVVIFLTVLLPEITKRYEQSQIAPIINFFIRQGMDATQDPPSPAPPAEQPPKSPSPEERK
ncbi:MAG: hypothetical protein HOP18_18670 [Deltaproteobacteria bacterium]|nr:hypothetical protein [Deltaproteobacteria bacterium]